jgi:polyhydroxyalkanoate synthesis regulator phasin
MAERDEGPENIFQWLFEAGEIQVQRLVEEILRNPKVGETLAAALKGAAQTKGQLDRNLEMVLSVLNLPSRNDIARVEAKIEGLEGSLVNLNIKVDRVLAAKDGRVRPVPRRTQRPRPGSSVEKPG